MFVLNGVDIEILVVIIRTGITFTLMREINFGLLNLMYILILFHNHYNVHVIYLIISIYCKS